MKVDIPLRKCCMATEWIMEEAYFSKTNTETLLWKALD